jgi:lipopolysaccharide/colanic/teichoic acid biosynthesis glycosyltransferase
MFQSFRKKLKRHLSYRLSATRYIDAARRRRTENESAGFVGQTMNMAQGHRDKVDSLKEPRPRKIWAHAYCKRLFDLSLAIAALLCSLPVFAIVAVLIKCSSPGPVLFRQARVGKGQKLFTIYKFRTMHRFAERHGPSVTRLGDPRLTRVGSLLRRFKLDEMPQLFNVIIGEMSFVGPRPKVESHEHMRMHCRPGITGAATMVFTREEEFLATVPEQQVELYAIRVLNPIKAYLDERYAEEGTFYSDLGILLTTVLRLGRSSDTTELPDLSGISVGLEMHAEEDCWILAKSEWEDLIGVGGS